MAKVVLILGTNKGDKKQNIENAQNLVAKEIGKIIIESGLYSSQSWGMDNLSEKERFFYNKVLVIESDLNPITLLDKLQEIETKMGRLRDSQKRYSSRIIDIDILFYNNLVYNDERLTIPHVQIANRNFVLKPLEEIMPDFEHPVLNKKISELAKQCKDTLAVSKI